MKLKRVLSLILVTAMLLSFLPSGVISVDAEPVANTEVDYKDGYTWSFDKAVSHTLSASSTGSGKGLFSNSATWIDVRGTTVSTDATLAFMNADFHYGDYMSRKLENGVLTTTVKKDIGWATPAISVYYRLPSGLKAGQAYTVDMELYAGGEDYSIGAIEVSFEFLEDLPDWPNYWSTAQIATNCQKAEKTVVTSAKVLSNGSGSVSFEISPTADVAADKWMLINVPLQTTASTYHLGDVTLKETSNLIVNGDFEEGETGWSKNGNFTEGSVTDGVLVLPATKTSGDAIFHQSMNLAPGAYQLTFDGKGTAGEYRPILYIGFNQGNKDYGEHFLKNFGFGEEWKTATVTFTIPESAADANTGLAPVYVALWTSNASYAPETEMQLDNFEVRKLLNVTTELSNATLGNTAATVAQGLGYETTVNANTGYLVSKVTVTMGDEVVANAYNAATGKISIPVVTDAMNIKVETDVDYNLIVNGNFGQGATGWSNNGITPAATIADGVLTLSTGKTTNGDARTYNSMQLAPGTYQLSFDVKGTPAQYRPYVGVSKNYWTNDYGQYFMVNYGLSDSEWTTITETFTVPASAADTTTGLAPVVVAIWNSNTSYAPVTEMQFDNFEVRKLLNVTTELSNATLGNTAATVAQGLSYETTVSANTGYTISNVTVTMDGEVVTNAYNADTGKISIPVVRGDLVIGVETTPKTYTVSVTGDGVQASHSNAATHGQPYSVELTTNEAGKKVVIVSVTESGSNKDYTFVNNVLAVENVTGALVITAKLEPVKLGVTLNNLSGVAVTLVPDTDVTYGEKYEGTLTIPAGEEPFLNVEVTMDGQPVDNAYANGTVTIEHVTGAVEVKVTHKGSCEIQQDCADSTSSNTATVVPTGGGFAATYTAKPGYEITGLTYTIGGATGDAANVTRETDGTSATINLTNITGKVVITVTTKAKEYQVVTDGAHVTNDKNSATHGQPYSATLTPEESYAIKSVTVTMGGQVVDGAYSNGTVTINSVTGEITITVETVAVDPDNLLWNGNFDLGEEGWGKNTHFGGSVQNGVLVVPNTKPGNDATFYQLMNLAPGTYQLSFDGKGTAGDYRPILYIGSQSWKYEYGKHMLKDLGFGEDWKTAVITFTLPESAAGADGLVPVYVTLCAANGSYSAVSEMQFDNFDVRKLYNVSVQNPDGGAVAGVKDFTVPNAAMNQPFEMVLEPLDETYNMSVSYVMGNGTSVQVPLESDGSAKIQIQKVTGDVKITVNAWKGSYRVVTNGAVSNSNNAQLVANGSAYYAEITTANSDKKLYSVTCMMGNTQVPVQVINGKAVINIAEVNGDIVITPVLVDKNVIAQWIFEVTKAVTGDGGEWGDAAQSVIVAHNGYFEIKNKANNQANGTTNIAPNLLTVTTNLPSDAAGWADASTVIGYKLPADLELGATYTMYLPIYAGNGNTTLASSKSGSTGSGVELVFTTIKPYNMWNAGDPTVTKIYAEGAGVLAAVAPSIGKLTTDSDNVFSISFTVTEEIKQYAVTGNYLALIINHQHKDGSYKIGNASLMKVTDPATVTVNTGDSVCDGAAIVQKGYPYIAQIAPKPGYKVVSAYYTMGGSAPVALTVVDGAVSIQIDNVTGDISITAVTEPHEPGNLLVNGSFILGDQFWSFLDEYFSIQASGGSDALNDPAFIQAAGKNGGILSQSFAVQKNTNYEMTFRYKGTVPQNTALWAITSKNVFAWNSVLYKASVENADDWTTVTVVFNSGNYNNLYLLFRTEDGSVYGLDNIWIKETDKAATVKLYKRPILGTRPNPSPYDDYPYICDSADNLMPDFGFETNTHYLENTISKVEADQNAWDGSNSLHYLTAITGAEAGNMLTNGDFANWDTTNKTITDWEFRFDNTNWMHKIDFVEIGGRRVVKLNACTDTEKFRLEMVQKVYLEAGFTYKFSFDFYGVANYGPNLPIYDANMAPVGTTANSNKTGTAGEWTTLTNTYTPTTSGYYYFSVRFHNDVYPRTEQYVSNCSVTLVSKGSDTRIDYELKELEANTDYWLTLFVKAPKVTSVADRFITFGLTDPETGDFILMASPDAEGGRPYKVDQQLVPMAYDGQWHIITVPFNTGDATWLNFTIDGTNCEAWFDNIYIFKDSDAKPFVSPATDKDEATITDETPDLLGCDENKNLFSNFNLDGGNAFWGSDARRFGVFGNALNVADSGSSIYGKALHYASGSRPTNTYYIKWIDVEPNTEYTFSAKYAITRKGQGFIGLINGYRVESEVTENRLFPTMIAQFGFGAEDYLESQEWQTIAVSFNSGERNRIGFVVCDAGGEAYIDELRLFKSSDGTVLTDATDTFPTELKSSKDSVVIRDGTVTGIPAGTTLEDVLKNFENSQYIRVYDAEGNEITEKTAKVGTGAVIRLMNGPAIKDAVAVIIQGDVNGDALVDGKDTAEMLGHITGKDPLEGAYLAAADMDADGKVTVSDAALNDGRPAAGTLSVKVIGPNAFAQKEEIEILLVADTNAIRAISGKLTPTDGLTFVKAEGELDGWELSVKRSGKDVYFAFGAVNGNAAKAGEALITLTFRVGMISTYDEAQLAITELFASTGADLLTGKNMNWMRQAPVKDEPNQGGGSDTVPQEPIVVATRNRLKQLSLAEVEISPAFDPEIKEYTATVPFEVDKVTVTAIAADDDAVVTIGDTNLEYVGKNNVAIRVVSADGKQRTYRIVITRLPPVEEPTEPEPTQPSTTVPDPTEPNVQQPEGPDSVRLILLSLAAVLMTVALIILIIILKKRKDTNKKR